MTIDEKTRKVVEGVMGINILKQIETVVPDFFDKDYIILRMIQKPKDKQTIHYPHVVLMEPKVMASTHPKYKVGTVLEVEDKLGEVVGDNYNVSVSPKNIRMGGQYIHISSEILEERPLDSLIIAEVQKEPGFNEPRIFYKYNAHLSFGRDVFHGRLEKKYFFEGLNKNNIHFAFVPAQEGERRESTYIEKFEVK